MNETTEGTPLEPKAWIGIDQSYSGFGLVVLRDNGEEAKNIIKFPNVGSDGKRLEHIYVTLVTLFNVLSQSHQQIHMAMEGYANNAKFGREKAGELGGVVKMAWYQITGTDAYVVPPLTLKKFVTGSGKASKEQMVASVNDKWNADIKNHNIADAYGLARMCQENYPL